MANQKRNEYRDEVTVVGTAPCTVWGQKYGIEQVWENLTSYSDLMMGVRKIARANNIAWSAVTSVKAPFIGLVALQLIEEKNAANENYAIYGEI